MGPIALYLILYFVPLLFIAGYGIYLYKTEWTFEDSELMFMCMLAVTPVVNILASAAFLMFLLSKGLVRITQKEE